MTRINTRIAFFGNVKSVLSRNTVRLTFLFGSFHHRNRNTIVVPSWMNFEPYSSQYIKIMKEINSRKK
jgi:hypothetical protein